MFETSEHLAALEKTARMASTDELVDLVGELEKIKGIAYARLASSVSAPAQTFTASTTNIFDRRVSGLHRGRFSMQAEQLRDRAQNQ